MALSVTEALAVNKLLRRLLEIEERHAPPVTTGQAMEAAALLADHAHKAISAGVTGVQVREAWLRKFED